jgi:hypothetical protein
LNINNRIDVTQVMVQFRDPGGLSRAYAAGRVGQTTEVLDLAHQHLCAYRQEKRELGDPLAYADYEKVVCYFSDTAFDVPRDRDGYPLKVDKFGAVVSPVRRAA